MAATFELFHRTHRTRHATHSRISGKNGLRIHRYAVMVTFLKFLKETQVITPPCLGQQPRVQCTHRLPFEFVIPNSLISARSDVAPEYLNLLPTVKEGPAFRGVNSQRLYMRPMIEYMLTASAMHIDSGRRYQCKQDISVMPSNAVAPPLQVEDFPRDYTLTSSKALKRHIWSRPIGKLTVSAVEPQPLNMSTNAPRASTTASIKLFFEPREAGECAIRPYDWSITVKSFLRIRTYITTRPFQQIPTQEIVETDPLVQVDSKATSASRRHCDTLPWRLHRLSPAGTITTGPLATPWTSVLIVPVNASKNLLPTFLSPLSARRYVLVLALKVGGLSHGTLALEIPIQVIHDPSETSNRSSRTLLGQEQERLWDPDVVDMASMSFKDGSELQPEAIIKPPPYSKD